MWRYHFGTCDCSAILAAQEPQLLDGGLSLSVVVGVCYFVQPGVLLSAGLWCVCVSRGFGLGVSEVGLGGVGGVGVVGVVVGVGGGLGGMA